MKEKLWSEMTPEERRKATFDDVMYDINIKYKDSLIHFGMPCDDHLVSAKELKKAFEDGWIARSSRTGGLPRKHFLDVDWNHSTTKKLLDGIK